MVLIIFAILAVIGQAINVFVCLALDNIFSPTVGALTFVVMYMLVFAAAWAVRRPHCRAVAAQRCAGERPGNAALRAKQASKQACGSRDRCQPRFASTDCARAPVTNSAKHPPAIAKFFKRWFN